MTVYFARVKGYVKIGYSVDPSSRMFSLLTGTCLKPDDLEYGDWADLLGTVPGDRERERELHAQFAEHRVVGEWFVDHPDIEQAIWDDPFGRPVDHLPFGAEQVMDLRPDVTRERAIEVAPVYQAEIEARVDSGLARMFGTHAGAEITEWMRRNNLERREAERAEYRAQGEAVA